MLKTINNLNLISQESFVSQNVLHVYMYTQISKGIEVSDKWMGLYACQQCK